MTAALLSLAFLAPANAEDASSPARAPLVTVAEARKITFVDNVLVTGSLVARDEVLAGAEIDGYRISAVLAEEGDTVKAGQVLATLARDALEAQAAQNDAQAARAQAAVDQARNQIAETEASLRQAEDAFNRAKSLRESGAASQATFDERELAFRTARARLAAQREGLRLAEAELVLNRAQRRELEVKLSHTEIKAPAAGLISRRTARLGAVASSGGEALFRIVKDGEIELDAEVPEFYMSKLKAGQRANVEMTGLRERAGAVRLVSPEVSATSRLGRVRISLGRDPQLRIGTFARAVIDAGQRDAVGVPMTAVMYQNDTATLLLVRDNKVQERQVKTGLLSGERVEIKEGLKAGDVVVFRAGSLLRGGDTITPQFMEQRTSDAKPTEIVQ
jgi:HlyD family secretion protein